MSNQAKRKKTRKMYQKLKNIERNNIPKGRRLNFTISNKTARKYLSVDK